jgi:hypothetical protein
LTQQHKQYESIKGLNHNYSVDHRTTPTSKASGNTTKFNTLENNSRTTHSTEIVDTTPNNRIVVNAEVQTMNGLLVNRKKKWVDLG